MAIANLRFMGACVLVLMLFVCGVDAQDEGHPGGH